MRIFFFLLASVAAIAASTFQRELSVTRSNVTFKIRNAGFNVHGRLSDLKAIIDFHPDNLTHSSIDATVNVSTMDTGIKMRDRHLQHSRFFDAEHFPQIKMHASEFKSLGGNSYEGVFNLTIRGVTKKIDVPFTFGDNAQGHTFKGSFNVNRREFGIGGRNPMMSDVVKVSIEVATI